MTSKTPDAPKAAFVWIWLAEATKPVDHVSVFDRSCAGYILDEATGNILT